MNLSDNGEASQYSIFGICLNWLLQWLLNIKYFKFYPAWRCQLRALPTPSRSYINQSYSLLWAQELIVGYSTRPCYPGIWEQKFLDWTQWFSILAANKITWELFKNTFPWSKETIEKTKRQLTDGRKLLQMKWMIRG